MEPSAQFPDWLAPGVRVWFFRALRRVGEVSAAGVVVEVVRRGYVSRRLLTPAEVARALEFGELRPDPRRVRSRRRRRDAPVD